MLLLLLTAAFAQSAGVLEPGQCRTEDPTWYGDGVAHRSPFSGSKPELDPKRWSQASARMQVRGEKVCVELFVSTAGDDVKNQALAEERADVLVAAFKGLGARSVNVVPVWSRDRGQSPAWGFVYNASHDTPAPAVASAAVPAAAAPAAASPPATTPKPPEPKPISPAPAVAIPASGSATAAVATPSPLPTALPSIDDRLPTGHRAPGDAAVVIGLEDYIFVPDVPYARRDAEAFYTFLLYTRGIPRDRIALLTSGSVEHIRKAVEEAGKSVSADGTVWVFYAGHGAASPSTRKQVILGDDVRADDVSFDARSVPLPEIQTAATAGGGTAVLLIDACFSGVGRSGESLLDGHRTLVPAQAIQSVQTAYQWTSTRAGQASVPLEAVRHGAFTYAAIGALRGWADGEFGAKDGKVTAEEADAYVSRALRTLQIRDQTPQFLGDTGVVLSEGATESDPVR